ETFDTSEVSIDIDYKIYNASCSENVLLPLV
ncbi:MAG: hypothetical protein QOG48_326, partial [Verrucomicrobiota bacterium]